MNVMDKKGPYSLQALDGPFFNGVSDYLNLESVWWYRESQNPRPRTLADYVPSPPHEFI